MAGQGTTGTCFYSSEKKESVSFTGNHLFALQDIQHQPLEKPNKNAEDESENKML